jgi:hypothetical protein
MSVSNIFIPTLHYFTRTMSTSITPEAATQDAGPSKSTISGLGSKVERKKPVAIIVIGMAGSVHPSLPPPLTNLR